MPKNPALCKNEDCNRRAVTKDGECVHCAFSLVRLLREIGYEKEADDMEKVGSPPWPRKKNAK